MKLVLDYETEAIGPRPKEYPPKPVGYAWQLGKRKGYEAWGHPDGNNTTFEAAKEKLRLMLKDADGVIAHNALFDLEVTRVGMGLNYPKPFEDTMVLLFLNDPYGQLSLKPASEKLLGLPPEEQNELHDWIVANVQGATRKTAGAYISKAPVKLVKPYAMGDVERTDKLFKLLHPKHGGSPAYKRELELQDVVLAMEQHGVRLDKRILADTNDAFKKLQDLDNYLRKSLGDIDMDTDAQIAEALEKRGKLSHPLPLTEKGAISTNKHALIACVKSKELLGHMLLRGALATCARSFMSNWADAYRVNNGRLYFKFNPVRSEYGVGARTGRMSCSPSLMNVPSKWELLYATFERIKFKPPFKLPDLRTYLLPEEGDALGAVDYSQQEMRIFAHYEDGALMHAYAKDPTIDAHQMVAELAGVNRKVAKTLNFAALYGAGLAVVMSWLDCTEAEARSFKAAYAKALPGVRDLQRTIDATANSGQPIETIGGRHYLPETPKYIGGQLRNFNYKLLNYLIQGSAADQTKQAMIDYWKAKERKGLPLFVVHDEIVFTARRDIAKNEAELLAACMRESLADLLDVKFLTDSSIGENYGAV